ncbi:MAG: nucleotide pyrophosphohydrolase [Acidobacteria bacterium]|nr:nucleotide pyrophosphohydrolase [Acidobacteriota bacterium]
MAALTHESLVTYLIEESYEVVEAIEGSHPDAALAGELGDLLLQVVLHAQLAAEQDRFDLAAVAELLTAKMIRRNPHVFAPDGSLRESFPATVAEIEQTWHAVKQTERPEGSVFAGIPAGLPALVRAAKIMDRAERAGVSLAGFVVSGAAGSGEPAGCAAGAASGETKPPANESELGALLFAVVRQAHSAGLDPERALRAHLNSLP